jgi:photosystem II stability/assembly factor-like uncharacterized protein
MSTRTLLRLRRGTPSDPVGAAATSPSRRSFAPAPWVFGLAAVWASAAPSGPLLLDAAHAGHDVIVAVGERGTVLRWSAEQPEWRRMQAPETPTLCGVTFADRERGWAVGHGGVVLGTTDGGVSWQIVYRDHDPETSFLDVLALDAQRVIAIGGFGMYLETRDAGRTWQARRILEEDTHLNRLSRTPRGSLFIAGEAGTLLRSRDEGHSWEALETANDASFYGVLPLSEGSLLAYGLRGRVYRSDDNGDSWHAVETPTEGLLLTGVQLDDGAIVLGGQARTAIASRDGGRTFIRAEHGRPAIAELLPREGGELLGFGEGGIAHIDVP